MGKIYNPISKQTLAGKKFQDKVLLELSAIEEFKSAEDLRLRLKSAAEDDGKPLSDYELNCLEKNWGDITFLYQEERYYIECCFAMGKTHTSMDETKRKRFIGDRHWYCWGRWDQPESRIFIHSSVWRKYMGKIKLQERAGWKYRTLAIKQIGPKIRSAVIGIDDFVNKLESMNME